MLRGISAIVEENNIQYYIKRGNSGKNALEFLQNLLKDLEITINKCYTNAGEIIDEEMALLEAFKAKGIIKGNYQIYFSVGHYFKKNFICNLKFIDAICEEKDKSVWVFEVERTLNYIAIGQVISYKYLYDKDNIGIKSKSAIMCGTASKDLKEACGNNQIQVFEINNEI